MAAAIARGVNDWTLETWVRPYDCFKGSILVAQQDPAQAVAEIDRLGDDPGMVQVLMGSASESPFGRRQYHPIYEACVRHGLPLALHIGGEGAGMSPPSTAVGHPTTYFEWYGSLPQVYMAHIMSMVTEGVFEKFPTLKVVLYEGGMFWLPHIMWRFDKNWKAQRAETPWVKQPPSAYILRPLLLRRPTRWRLCRPGRSSTQVLEMIEAERTLLFSSNYPNWDLRRSLRDGRRHPRALRRRVMVENALALYGERLWLNRLNREDAKSTKRRRHEKESRLDLSYPLRVLRVFVVQRENSVQRHVVARAEEIPPGGRKIVRSWPGARSASSIWMAPSTR